MKRKHTKPVAEPAHIRYKVDHITPNVRCFLSNRFIQEVVRSNRTENIFLQSQTQDDYERACESWHVAFWKWIDKETPSGGAGNFHLDGRRLFAADPAKMALDRELVLSEFPCPEADRKLFMVEFDRNHALMRLASFKLELRRPGQRKAELYYEFFPDAHFSKKLGDKSYSKLMDMQTQRKKPKEASGGRQLKFILLWYWIPACLWAMTVPGIAKTIEERAPVACGRRYHSATIRRAVRELKLFHSPKPLWSGLKGDPPRPIQF